jgi:hypothetical protein
MNLPAQEESPATEAETRAFLLARSKRTSTPILKGFVQKPRGATDRSGPLSTFVRNRDLRGLQAFLFMLSITSSGFGPGRMEHHSANPCLGSCLGPHPRRNRGIRSHRSLEGPNPA